MLEQHLRKLVDDLELEMPPKEDLGGYLLKLSPMLEITLKELDPGISCYMPLGPLPLLKREELLIYVMKANFLGQGTGGGTLALDENENLLTLSFTLPYDMNYKTFKEALEDFANYADYWKEELVRHKKAAEEGHRE